MKQSRPADMSRILVGLNIVGIVGLQDALRSVAEAGLNEREEVIDFILECVASLSRTGRLDKMVCLS